MPISGLVTGQMVTEGIAANAGFSLKSGQNHGSGNLCMTKLAATTRYNLKANFGSYADNQLIPQQLWENGQDPSGLTVGNKSATTLDLNWNAATSIPSVTNYLIYRQGVLIETVGNVLFYRSTGLTPGTNYSFQVFARNAVPQTSSGSNTAAVTTDSVAADTTPPSAPLNVYANQAGASEATIGWDPSTDNVGVVSYEVHRSGSGANGLYNLMATVADSPFTDSGLIGDVEYWYKIRAIDAANNVSAFSIEAYLYMLT